MGLGSDFAMYYGATRVLQEGGNPYDHNLVFRTERSIMNRESITMTKSRGWVRVGNPPFFLWAIQPLERLPFRTAGWLWIALMFACSVVGFFGCLRALGWTVWMLPTAVFLAMPQTLIGAINGNVSAIIFAAFGTAIALLARRPAIAGAILSLSWLKPSVALPFVALIILFHASNRVRLVQGFALGTTALFVLTLFATGSTRIGQWIAGLSDYSHDIAAQPEIAPLSGLFARWAPSSLRTLLTMLILGVATALTLAVLRRQHERTAPYLAVGWLWIAWFLATPYAHIYDEVLLTIPILALLGLNANRVDHPLAPVVLYLLFFCVILNGVPGINADLESLKLLGVAGLLALAARDGTFVERPGDTSVLHRQAL